MSPKRLVVAGLFAAALPGCELFEMNIVVPEVCQDLSDMAIAGMPGGTHRSLEQSVAIDLAGALAKANIDVAGSGSLDLTRIAIWPTSGIIDFRFVDEGEIAIQGDAAVAPRAVVARYARDTVAAAPLRLETEPDAALDLLPYVRSGKVDVSASFLGVPPNKGWSFSGEVCARAKTKVKLF